MPKSPSRKILPKEVIIYVRRRIKALEEVQRNVAEEVLILKALLGKFRPCPECNGEGDLFQQDKNDDVRRKKCKKCKGTGAAD